jgi:hypothetical protein
MATHAQCCVRGRLQSGIVTLRRRLVGAGHAQAAVEFGTILAVALFVLVVAGQFAFIGEAARALGQANYRGARSMAMNPAANQSAASGYITEHIEKRIPHMT